MSETREIRWGMLATGAIALTFARDILLGPEHRGPKAVKHTIVAAASSSSASKAADYLKEIKAPSDAKAYGSYEELVKDPNVEIVYVATPHSHHFQNAMLCLEAGKHVLCEKAFTVNGKQARILIERAREKKLFLMEAMWTRYCPLMDHVRELLAAKTLGTIYRVTSDFSNRMNPEVTFSDSKHRVVNPETAGGALLDLGVYSLNWPFLVFGRPNGAKTTVRPKVSATMTKYRGTMADESSSILLTFPRDEADGGNAHAIATTSWRVATPKSEDDLVPSVRIEGEKGEIRVYGQPNIPRRMRLMLTDGTVEDKKFAMGGPGAGSGWYNGFWSFMGPEGECQGMYWEADAAGQALIDGELEAKQQDLDETLCIMETLDEVRRQCGQVYGDKVESTEYPLYL